MAHPVYTYINVLYKKYQDDQLIVLSINDIYAQSNILYIRKYYQFRVA